MASANQLDLHLHCWRSSENVFFWTSAGSALAAWQSLGRMQSGVVPSRRWDRILPVCRQNRVSQGKRPIALTALGLFQARAVKIVAAILMLVWALLAGFSLGCFIFRSGS